MAGGLAKAVYGAREAHPDLAVEVECRDLDEVSDALGVGADLLLLDNMDDGDPARGGPPPRRESPRRQGALARGVRRRHPGDGAGDRRDRRRPDLDRRAHPLGSPLDFSLLVEPA